MAEASDAKNITLTHFILSEERTHPEATGELSILLHAIEIASKYISSKVRAAGLFNLYGEQGDINVQGEVVKKLDVIANDSMITCLKRSMTTQLLVSEENPEAILVEPKYAHGKYVAVFDPLDGSSNIDANVSIGTIFGVYKKKDLSRPATLEDVLQPGKDLVAAGYTMYGSATILVLSSGNGVNGFTLDPSSGEFVLTHPKIKTKNKFSIYSVNEGNTANWEDATKKYVESVKFPKSGKPYSARYVGSMVADVHRTLLYGGIFMYPADSVSKSGKLRLLYEANPMAFIMEQAGGKASTGTQRILDIIPTDIHQRTPVFIGSKENVDELEAFYKQFPPTFK